MESTSHPRRLVALSSAALVLGLALAGCGAPSAPPPSESSGPGAIVSSTPASSPSGAGASASSAAPSSRPSASAEPASSSPPAAPTALSTFTFPDGRVSFDYPASWTVDLFHSADAVVPTATSTVKDQAGRAMATVYIGQIADAVGQSGARTVYESLAVPGLAGLPAPAAHVTFYRLESGGVSHYSLSLTSGAVQSGSNTPGQSPVNIIQTGTGVMTAEVVWDSPTPFVSEEAAKAWYASDEGRALRALLLSITYR